MLRCCAWVLPCLVVLAEAQEEDSTAEAIRAFRANRTRFYGPDGKVVAMPALARLVATKDPRAVQPLVQEILALGRELQRLDEQDSQIQRGGRILLTEQKLLKEEIDLLELQLRGGAGVGPTLRAKQKALASVEKRIYQAKKSVVALEQIAIFAVQFRRHIIVGASKVLAAIDAKPWPAEARRVRRLLIGGDPKLALWGVEILTGAGRAEAEPVLLAVLADAKVPEPARWAVVRWASTRRTRATAEAVVAAWRADPKRFGPRCRSALSLAARRHLPDPDAAAAWAAGLPH